MVKEITVNGIKCRMKSSAAIPRIYRIKFHRDIFVDMEKMQKQMKKNEKNKEDGEEGSSIPIDSLEMFENIAYLMHKHGDPSQPDDINEWLDQFETFDIYQVLPEILQMWSLETKQTSIPKKKPGK